MSPGLAVFLVIALLFIVFCLFMAVRTSRAKKRLKMQQKQSTQAAGASASICLPLVAGLPAPEGTLCTLLLLKDKLRIDANGAEYSLELSRITDVTSKTDVEIQRSLASSAGGAVAGGLMFGAVGALIGGRAKTKTTRQYRTYMIVSYTKDSTVDYIAFETSLYGAKPAKFVAVVRNAIPKQSTPVSL